MKLIKRLLKKTGKERREKRLVFMMNMDEQDRKNMLAYFMRNF